MGIVFRAAQSSLDREVALKVISPELAEDRDFRERFEHEARIAASIEHPSVVPIYEAGANDGILYIAMRLVAGENLRQMMDVRPLDVGETVRIMSDVAAALDAAHARGLIHRDVKPANVLIDRTGHVYLTDFGLTKREGASSGPTRTGQWVGTLAYVAPEQIRGDRVDARADVYALGCVAYEAIAGRPPFTAEHDVAIMHAHLERLPPPLAGNLARFNTPIARALEKDPKARYPSTGDFARALQAADIGETPAVPERSVATGAAAPPRATEPAALLAPRAAATTRAAPDSIHRHKPTPNRRRWTVAFVAIAALAGITVGAIALGGGSSDQTTRESARTRGSAQASSPKSVVAGPSTVTVVTTAPAKTQTSTRTSASPPASNTDWPAGLSAWTVVLASETDRNAAQTKADQASSRFDGPTGVLRSDDYESLRPGYWVAFAGQLDTREQAISATRTMRRTGFADAYPRYVAERG